MRARKKSISWQIGMLRPRSHFFCYTIATKVTSFLLQCRDQGQLFSVTMSWPRSNIFCYHVATKVTSFLLPCRDQDPIFSVTLVPFTVLHFYVTTYLIGWTAFGGAPIISVTLWHALLISLTVTCSVFSRACGYRRKDEEERKQLLENKTTRIIERSPFFYQLKYNQCLRHNWRITSALDTAEVQPVPWSQLKNNQCLGDSWL